MDVNEGVRQASELVMRRSVGESGIVEIREMRPWQTSCDEEDKEDGEVEDDEGGAAGEPTLRIM